MAHHKIYTTSEGMTALSIFLSIHADQREGEAQRLLVDEWYTIKAVVPGPGKYAQQDRTVRKRVVDARLRVGTK